MAVDIVIAAAKERAVNGTLRIDVLDEISMALKANNNQVGAFCQTTYERCNRKIKLDLLFPLRTNAYGRIMIEPLGSLFDKRERRMSTLQIANFFHALTSILGRDLYEQYHDEVSELLRAEIREKDSPIDWEVFFRDPRIVCIRRQTLIAVAHSFKNFEQRVNWFIGVMEGGQEDAKHKEGNLQFTQVQVKAFLTALFSEFTHMNPAELDQYKEMFPKKERMYVAHLLNMLPSL